MRVGQERMNGTRESMWGENGTKESVWGERESVWDDSVGAKERERVHRVRVGQERVCRERLG